jgi:hypothetical protein
MKRPSNKVRYGAAYVREAARRHEERRKQQTPVYRELACRPWRVEP